MTKDHKKDFFYAEKRPYHIYTIAVLCMMLAGLLSGNDLLYGFTVSPGRIELVMDGGGTHTGTYTIGNPDSVPIKIRLSATDLSSGQESGKAAQIDSSSLSWLAFMPREVELAPGGSQTVQFNVRIPKEAKGEYAAMIYFAVAKDGDLKGGIGVSSRIGNALYVIIRGTENISGKINSVDVTGADPIKLVVVVENMGNIHIRPNGTISIKKEGSRPKKGSSGIIELPFNNNGFPVMPNQSFTFDVRSAGKLTEGAYMLDLRMDFGGAEFKSSKRFGVSAEGKIKTLL